MNEANTAEPNELLAALGGKKDIDLQELKDLVTPSSTYSPGPSSSIEERALSLLGSGINSESVASALGVTPSRISQLLAEKTFANKVANLRYENLQKHNARDDRYDSLEDKLIVRLESSLPLLIKPESILKAITTINGAKRRGKASSEQVSSQQNIVNIVLPTIIKQKFSTDINNQVVRAGEQELMTMPSGDLLKRVELIEENRLLAQEESEPE